MILSLLKEKQKSLKHLLLEKADFSKMPVYIIFSYLGARVCYSSCHPLLIFDEEKFKNPEKFRDFLLHLKRMNHFSIFAHTPVPVRVDDLSAEQKFLLASLFFKSIFPVDESPYAIFNLRHFAEILEEEEFARIIDVKSSPDKIEVTVIKAGNEIFRGKLSEVPEEIVREKENEVFVKPEIIILRSSEKDVTDWTGVIAHNFSRIFSHQFVRHTWLNFNQRSHRYTKIDHFILPEVFHDDVTKKYLDIITTSMKYYQEIINSGIKKEWARFVTPQGCATTVLATAPEFVWKDFIEKRNIPQAQGEIRELARIIQKAIL